MEPLNIGLLVFATIAILVLSYLVYYIIVERSGNSNYIFELTIVIVGIFVFVLLLIVAFTSKLS